MGRAERTVSESGYYHVVLKANGGQLLFETDADRRAFLSILAYVAEKSELGIHAWCLMGNHVHLLLSDREGNLSVAMQVLAATYARRFNSRAGRDGAVFQPRFYSSPIEDDGYLLSAVHYIHANPQNAGICAAADYPWSSYHEYLGQPTLSDTALVLDLLGGRGGFIEFSSAPDQRSYRFEGPTRVAADEMYDLAVGALDGRDPTDLKRLPPEERNAGLESLREAGLSLRQIQMVSGIGYRTVQRILCHKSV